VVVSDDWKLGKEWRFRYGFAKLQDVAGAGAGAGLDWTGFCGGYGSGSGSGSERNSVCPGCSGEEE
jgi:hypothetical protein